MELPTEEEFTIVCSEHLWTFTMESDLNKAMKGLKNYHYMKKVIKEGGSKYKKIHRKAFENFIDRTKEIGTGYVK